MFGFLNKKNRNRISVIDLRDGSVGGMTLSVDKERKSIPEKIHSIRKELPFQKNLSFKRLFYSTAQLIPQVALSMQKIGLGESEDLYCIIGPHFYFSETRVIRKKFGEPRLIDRKLVDDLLNKEIEEVVSGHPTNNIVGAEPSTVVLDKKIMQIKLNGYETTNPFGKSASEIRISLFLSLIPRIVVRDLYKLLRKNFHNNNIHFHSSTFVAFDSIRSLDMDKEGFVVVSVEKETTEVSVVRDGILEENSSIPMGQNFFKRAICAKYNTIPDEAETYLKLYIHNSGDLKRLTEVFKFIEDKGYEWRKSFFSCLKSLSEHHLLPENFYLTAGDDNIKFFTNLVRESEIAEILTYNKPPSVRRLDQNVFDGYCRNKSDCLDDVHFVTGAVYVNKIAIDNNLTLLPKNIII